MRILLALLVMIFLSACKSAETSASGEGRGTFIEDMENYIGKFESQHRPQSAYHSGKNLKLAVEAGACTLNPHLVTWQNSPRVGIFEVDIVIIGFKINAAGGAGSDFRILTSSGHKTLDDQSMQCAKRLKFVRDQPGNYYRVYSFDTQVETPR